MNAGKRAGMAMLASFVIVVALGIVIATIFWTIYFLYSTFGFGIVTAGFVILFIMIWIAGGLYDSKDFMGGPPNERK